MDSRHDNGFHDAPMLWHTFCSECRLLKKLRRVSEVDRISAARARPQGVKPAATKHYPDHKQHHNPPRSQFDVELSRGGRIGIFLIQSNRQQHCTTF